MLKFLRIFSLSLGLFRLAWRLFLDKRILNLDLTVGIGEGSMLVDDREIYTAKGLKVGLFQDTSSF